MDNCSNFSPTGTTFHPPLFTRQYSALHQLFTTAQNFSPPHKFSPAKTPYTRENTGGKFKKTGERQQL
jgi:hypothetical protein